jgi:hypothetical protein
VPIWLPSQPLSWFKYLVFLLLSIALASFLRAVLDVFLQQNAVVQFQHLQVNAADEGKVTAPSAYLHSERRTRPSDRRSVYSRKSCWSVSLFTHGRVAMGAQIGQGTSAQSQRD